MALFSVSCPPRRRLDARKLSHEERPLFDSTDFDWDTYIRYRPAYDASFYQRIYDYHTSKDGEWHTAHDIGTGPGIVAKELASRFGGIVASDASHNYTRVARQRLSQEPESSKFNVLLSRGEDIAEHPANRPSSSADMVTVAECLPFMDVDIAVSSFWKLLRPGGTLAVWFYGKPFFADDSLTHLNELHVEVMTQLAKDFIQTWKDGTPHARANNLIASWFDNLSLPEEDWENVQRYKFNSDMPLSFVDESAFPFQKTYESKIASGEHVEDIKDRSFWSGEVDMDSIRGFVKAWTPQASKFLTPENEHHLEKMERAMGGSEAKYTVSYPAVLILATKKRSTRPRPRLGSYQSEVEKYAWLN